MHRILSLWLPLWPIERRFSHAREASARRARSGSRAASARLVVEMHAGVRRIAHACPRSMASGVTPGMTLVEARALLPEEPQVADDDPAADLRALRRLARWCHRFTPRVAVDPPDGVLLDITGMHRLVVSEAALAARVLDRVRRLGLTGAGAIASTPLGASALARYHGAADRAAVPIVPPGDEAASLDPLPVRAVLAPFGSSDGMVTAEMRRRDAVEIDAAARVLEEVGVRSMADLRRLPRAELVSRIGGRALARLDRALGVRDDPLEPVPAVEAIVVERCFSGPVRDPVAIETALHGLLADLADRIARRGVAVRALVVVLRRADASPLELPVRFARPVVCARHMAIIARPVMERANLGFGVEGIRVRVRAAAPRVAAQDALPGLLASAPQVDADPGMTTDDRRRGELIDRFVACCGDDAVRTVHVSAGRAPGYAWAWPRATAPMRETCADATPRTARPSRLLDRPQPLPVLERDGDGVPRRICLSAHARSVVAIDAPEYLSLPWWRVPETLPTEREYRRIREEGGRSLWIFRAAWPGIGPGGAPGSDAPPAPHPAPVHGRDGSGDAWFLHGEWA